MARYQHLDSKISGTNWQSPASPEFPRRQQQRDPFSDAFSSGPNSPISPTLSRSSSQQETLYAEDSEPFKAGIQCCRCDQQQPLFSDWNDRASTHNACCLRCTSAFCGKCIISSDEAIQFDGKCRADVPASMFSVSFHWFCSTCGVFADVPVSQVKRQQGIATLEPKALKCEPCNQKATSATLFIASVGDKSQMPHFQLSSRMPDQAEKAKTDRPRSDSWFSRRSWSGSTSESSGSWSMKSVKRWTSLNGNRNSMF
jgi:hypothetical protein